MAKKVFISQPMRGLDEGEIQRVRSEAVVYAENYLGEEVREIPSYFEGGNKLNPVAALGMAIKLMSDADLIIFCHGWQDARECCVEHTVAVEYSMTVKEL